jgi:hypothetical protein
MLVAGIFVMIPIIFFGLFTYAVGFSDWWLKFPEPTRSQIALMKMEGLGSGIGCRDNCIGDKLGYRIMIMNQLSKNGYDSGVGELMLKHVTWENKSVDYRRELIGLIRSNEDLKKEKDQSYQIKMPVALLAYLNNVSGNTQVKSQILTSFPEDAAASDAFISNLLALSQDKSKSYEERMQAITSLKNIMTSFDGDKENPTPKHQNIDHVAICDIFLTMAEVEKGKTAEDLKFRRHILNSMNGCLLYKELYKEDFFNRLLAIFYEDGVYPGIQRELMTELGYYDRVDSKKFIETMLRISNDQSLNKITRSDAEYELKEANVEHQPVGMLDEEYYQLKSTLDFYTNLEK